MTETFKLVEDSLQQRFLDARDKIQIYAGGFANGKTASSVIKGLQLAKDYPGSNGLIARETYPKLNDTIRAEWLKWCPPKWIKSFPRSKNSENTCYLQNGSTINFRYVKQQGKGKGESTSNLLSATYDWAIVDQIEDPGITLKDFTDILGRLRGSTPYVGDDPTMPDTGPRWFIVTCNPTRNWFYKQVVRPYHQWLEDHKYHENLMCETDSEGRPVFDENGEVTPILNIFEGSTYENRQNLKEDYIRTLEATYRNTMRERFLLGLWAGYEGLIYPQYDDSTHFVSQSRMIEYLWAMRNRGFGVNWIEAFDHGIAVPSCYGLAFIDPQSCLHIIDGFYENELSISQIIEKVKKIRQMFIATNEYRRGQWLWADPAVFRRQGGAMKTVGPSIAELMWDHGHGLRCVRANNDITNGIVKVSSYLDTTPNTMNPYTSQRGGPHLFFSDACSWIDAEMSDYYWDKDPDGEPRDKPIDRNDHAMDMIKYMLTDRPKVSDIIPQLVPDLPRYMMWHEAPEEYESPRAHRYG